MLFNSLQYAVFLPVVFALYWIVPHKRRWLLVLLSSYYFYMSWNAKYLLLIVFITGVSYAGAILVEREKNIGRKKLWVGAVIVTSLALLFVFKYFNFVSELITKLLNMMSIPTSEIVLSLLLPVGISFYTFQAIGYTIDVYRGDVPAEHHFGKYAAFVAFFPQLVAGPIERTRNLLPQLKEERFFDYGQATYGLKLMAWGYFKKIVVADTLAIYVDKIYGDMHFFSGFARLAVIFLFPIQIYCDFSGYSDIARGTAKLFGVELMENFKSPYFTKSMREFWRRWHISLSSWFRDYVYIPLGGNRKGQIRSMINVVIMFTLSGLWHGASLNFVVWGFLHGCVQVFERLRDTCKEERKYKVPYPLKVIINYIVFSVLLTIFRAQGIKDAAYMLVYWYQGIQNPVRWVVSGFENLGISGLMVLKLLFMFVLLGAFDYISLKKDVISSISKWKFPCRWALYIGLIVLIFFWAPAESAQFIYFDF